MNYKEALKVIENKQSLGIKPGLERIYVLLEIMGNPQNELKIIHIAGTNGKGTVSTVLASSLEKQGFKVGLFTSPWVIDYKEQIQINFDYISEEAFADYVEKYSPYDATEFELITAIAYKYFYDNNVDYAVVECGMGGAEDSTNAFDFPELAVITSVSMDHTDFLGNTLEKIAEQKAGIIKENSKAVLYPNPETLAVFEKRCKDKNARLFLVDDKKDYFLNDIETVRASLTALGLKDEISLVKLPARQEYLTDNVMLDGAHNTDGALALKKNLPKREITAVIGMMRDKDVDSYLSIVAPYCSKIIAVTPSNSRSMPASELKEIAMKYCRNVTVLDDLKKISQIKDYDFLLVCGSFYLARDVRKYLL